MSPVSDQQWLRQIGVDVTADTDDEDAGVSDDPVELDDDASAEIDDEPAEFEDPSTCCRQRAGERSATRPRLHPTGDDDGENEGSRMSGRAATPRGCSAHSAAWPSWRRSPRLSG